MGTALVIVESPTKAKTIEDYLPQGYVVLSSMGHIRDLPSSADEIPAKVKSEPWSKIGVNYENNFEPLYVISKGKKKIVTELKAAMKNVDELILATDEDREGESISWHLLEVLKPSIPVKRMVFHEITREAIEAAIADCRDVDDNLVRAQETRRILDRLVGYTLSPVLWKKIGGQLSAGRVQSVAVRLLVERERERRAFRKGSYWDLKAQLTYDQQAFPAVLTRLAGKRLATGKDFDENTGNLKAGSDVVLLEETAAKALVSKLERSTWNVTSVEEKPQTRKPSPPFITSTLQQEANRKLNLSAREAMRVAQDLYQRGFITYMRTDSVHLSGQAIEAARSWVKKEYGDDYLSDQPKQFKTSSKGAQEAHEAIRPSGSVFKSPKETGLTGVNLKLYELIWKRTVASQMADSRQTNIGVIVQVEDAEFRASGKRIDFPGFFRAYVEGSDDPDAAVENQEVILPTMAKGDQPGCNAIEALGHETKPPARFTEATLVKKLEAEGVGRPSTYASIIGTIIERGYCKVESKALTPTYRAFAVTQLLEKHFPKFVDLGFTADMEQTLDKISEGDAEWLPYLEQFYNGEQGLFNIAKTREADVEPDQARTIVLEGIENAAVRIGRFGPYLEKEIDGESVRATIPEDVYPGELNQEDVDRILQSSIDGPQSIGDHPDTGEPIYMLTGRFGWYVQLGETPEDKKIKPKRGSLLKGMTPDDVDLEIAVALLSLPRTLGDHPDGGTVQTAVGRFGPYVVHNTKDDEKDFRSLKATDNVLTVQLDRALELLAEPKGKRGRGASSQTVLKELGEHPEDKQPIRVLDGRYGPYVKYNKVNASVPKDESIDDLTLERALELIEARASRKTKKKTTKKKSTKKATKKAAKKKTSKKKTTKKAG